MNDYILPVIPEVKSCIREEGDTVCARAVFTDCSEWQMCVNTFCRSFEKIHGCPVRNEPGGVELLYDASIRPDGYRICTDGGIRLYASEREGANYALVTALQLLTPRGDTVYMPKVTIEDYPDKDYRALMVDLARGWHPARTVYKYIDLCYLLKIKYIQLHFGDDQSYTLPSRVFPNLSTPGRSYTFEEVQSFIDYAAARGVIAFPEIDVPGHASAFLSAYPEIFRDNIDPDKRGGNIICAGSPETEKAVERLIDEMCELFPDAPYIHIGGDEAMIASWKNCSVCRKYMEERGIEDEYELYSDFVGRVSRMVLKRGKTPIVWEGFPKKGSHRIPKETIVMAWESYYHQSYELLEEGFQIINASWKPLYITPERKWTPRDILAWDLHTWSNWNFKSEAALNPIHVQPTDQLLGGMLCVWEGTFDFEFGFTMENLAAASERIWTLKRMRTDEEYAKKQYRYLGKAARLVQDTK